MVLVVIWEVQLEVSNIVSAGGHSEVQEEGLRGRGAGPELIVDTGLHMLPGPLLINRPLTDRGQRLSRKRGSQCKAWVTYYRDGSRACLVKKI